MVQNCVYTVIAYTEHLISICLQLQRIEKVDDMAYSCPGLAKSKPN